MQLQDLTYIRARIHCGRIWLGIERGYYQQCPQYPSHAENDFHLSLCYPILS
jgi:hypothetical protein